MKKLKKPKKKREFKKIVLLLVVIGAFGCVGLSYLLALLGNGQTNAEIAVAMVYAVIGAVAAYCTANTVEKNSRNKYGIDSDGVPFSQKKQDLETMDGEDNEH